MLLGSMEWRVREQTEKPCRSPSRPRRVTGAVSHSSGWEKKLFPQPSGIDRHAYHGIYADGVERLDFVHRANAAGNDQSPSSRAAQATSDFHGEAGHCALAVYMSVEEGATVLLELPHHLNRIGRSALVPSLDDHLAGAGVDSEG